MPIVAEFIATRLTGATLITGSGILRGFLISHGSGVTDHTITFYDNTAASGTILLIVHIDHANMPVYIRFGRDDAIRFATGLSAEYGDSEVNVWAVQLT